MMKNEGVGEKYRKNKLFFPVSSENYVSLYRRTCMVFWAGLRIRLTLMWIRFWISLFNLMWVRIRIFTLLRIRILLFVKVFRICDPRPTDPPIAIFSLHASIVSIDDHPWLQFWASTPQLWAAMALHVSTYFEPLQLLNFDIDAEPYPNSQNDEDRIRNPDSENFPVHFGL